MVMFMKIYITEDSALIIVDMQNDFMPGGALPVKDADLIIPTINRYIKKFREKGRPIYATRDWHPENHISFNTRGGPWPPHCIQGTKGAEFHKDLELSDDVIIVNKAYNPDRDAYSGFQETFLDIDLRRRGISRIFVAGVATEYCVKSTVIDGLNLGYEVILLIDAIKGVDLNLGDSEKAIEDMLRRGAILATLDEVF